MIYGSFSKLQIVSGNPEDYINQVNLIVKRRRFSGLQELVFYASMTNPRELFGFTLWLNAEDLQVGRQALISEVSPSANIKRIFREHHQFRLWWEQQTVTLPVEASTINHLVFPAGYPEEQLIKLVKRIRELRWEIKGIRGIWVGRAMDNRHRILIRADWVSQEDLQRSLNSDFYRQTQHFYVKEGITTDLGSSQLRSLVHPE